MKKLSKLLLALVLWVAMTTTIMAQNSRLHAVQQQNMENVSDKEVTSPLKRNPTVSLGTNSHANTKTNVVSYKTLGSAANSFTAIGGNRTRVAANNALNTIAFVHRGTTSTGGSGTYKLDVSTNSGTSFTNDVAVYTNAAAATVGNGRYPQIVIHNPTGNTVPANAFVAGVGALTPSAGGWAGYGMYAAKFDGTTQSEATSTNNFLIAQTLHVANGIYWTIDYTTDAADGFSDTIVVLKGTWNTTLNKIDWTVNNRLKANALPYINPSNGNPTLGLSDACIAFAPNGMTGYIMMRGECTTKTVKSNTYSPVLWKTTDGGTTWTLIDKDFGTFNIPGTTDMLPNRPGGTTTANFFYNASMTVDANGKVHIGGSVTSSACSGNDVDSVGYLATNAFRGAVHIWGDGTTFTGRTMDSIQTYSMDYGYTGGTPPYKENARMQIARTEDGTKVFFVFGDDRDATGFPDLYVQGFNVNTGNYTVLMSPTDGTSKDNGAHLHSLAATVLGNTGCYELPIVFAEPSSNDVGLTTAFVYADDVSLCDAQFTVSSVNATAVTDVMTTFNAYPNPAAESVNFNYTLNNKANTELSIFALDGRVISTITKGNQAAGSYTYTFNRADLAAGVYMARFVVDGKVNHTKIVLQ